MIELGVVLDARIGAACRRHGLSHAALNALAVIEGQGRAVTPGEIGAAMHTTSGSITSVVDTLERNGFVRRSAHGDDRRKVLVEITPEGVARLDALLPEIAALTTALAAGLSPTELSKVVELSERLQRSSNAVTDDPPPTAQRRRPAVPT